jgi:hypothetical protein
MARLTAFLLAAAVLLAVQMLVLLVISQTGYWPQIGRLSRRSADLYFTLLEIPLLRILFPTEGFAVIMSAAAIGGTVCVALFAAASVKAMKLVAPGIISAVWVILLMIIFPLTESTGGSSWVMLAFMVLTVVIATGFGINLYESGEVAE